MSAPLRSFFSFGLGLGGRLFLGRNLLDRGFFGGASERHLCRDVGLLLLLSAALLGRGKLLLELIVADAQRRQGQLEGVIALVLTLVDGFQLARVFDAAAAELLALGVENLLPDAVERRAHAVVLAGDGLEVADDQHLAAVIGDPAERDDAVLIVVEGTSR